MLEWGRKWNIAFVRFYFGILKQICIVHQVETLRYDAKTNRVWSVAPDIDKRDSNGNLVTKQVFPPKAKTFTDEEFNASAVKHEDLVRISGVSRILFPWLTVDHISLLEK